MHENDNLAVDCEPTAAGILLCLRMLTEEAGSLNLSRSVLALRAAALLLEAETGEVEIAMQDQRRITARGKAMVM